MAECVVDADLALTGCQLKDAQILPRSSRTPITLKGVTGYPEPARRVQILLEKLGVKNSAEIVQYAIRNGLVI